MEITKVASSFGQYTAKLSFSELVALSDVLNDRPPESPALIDEMRASVTWHIEHVPGPGEDKDDHKSRTDAEDGNEPKPDEVPVPDDGKETGGEDFGDLEDLKKRLVAPPADA